MENLEFAGRSLVDLVFSWSLDDVLNKYLYKNKVKQIPKSFSSITHYMNSFIFPLIEETRADLCSSLTTLSLAPTFRISCIEISEEYKPPNNLLCTIDVEQMGCLEGNVESYEPETGELILLTDVKPKYIADMNDSKLSYVIALVQRVRKQQNGDEYKLTIRLSKPIASEAHYIEKDNQEITFAVFLTNMTTNIRIWKALNLQLGEGSLKIISNVLQTEQTVCTNCAICFHSERTLIDASTTGALIRSLDLNQSQEEAVLSCTALKDCYHKSTVKLIWGPPGTGKTKTIASFLFAMLKMKCTVVTCAPTNIAVVEVTRRVLKLASRSFDYGTYGLGDIVLFGNGKRMKIDDHEDLFDVFLDFRAHMLWKCLQPSSGWVYCLESMIRLLENPEQEYCLFLQNGSVKDDDDDEEQQLLDEINNEPGISSSQHTETQKHAESLKYKRITWKKIIAETIRNGKHKKNLGKDVTEQQKAFTLERNYKKDGVSNKRLTFEDFLKTQFHFLTNRLKFYTTVLYTHLPTSFISLKVINRMINSLSMLDNLRQFFGCVNVSNNGSDRMRKECVEALKSLRERFDVPDIRGEYEIKNFCLQNGHLFFCTCCSSIRLHEDGPRRVPVVVIDEAAQLKECESTIPLQLPGLRHAILIGDERQLPAMVKSKVSEKADFGRSLFERLVSLEHERHLLNIQYRMHPLISLFPNTEFYRKQILDAPIVTGKSYKKHILPGSMYGTYSFIDVSYGQEMLDNGHSLKNVFEVAIVCQIVCKLFREVSATKERITVGIISQYKAQVNAIEQKLGEMKNIDTNGKFSVRVRSVDGFQGGEEDVIIISTVRCNGSGLVGFLSDSRRTNVALTRARYCLWIIGNGATLIHSESVWKNLIVDAKARECFFDAEEDEDLAHAIAFALLELDQLDVSHLKSILFKRSRWKVFFSDNFWQSIVKIEKVAVRRKVISLLLSLSTGWRKPDSERYLSFRDGIPHLLEYIEVDRMHFLIWNVDIVEENSNYVQILKVWDVLPWFEIPKLFSDINTFLSSYTMDHLYCCKFRYSEGNLEVPMTWPIDAYAKGNYVSLSPLMEMLTNKFALLTLKD